jgi:hypothetical protein
MKKQIPFNNDALILLVDSHHGVFIPQIFAEQFADLLTQEQAKDLSSPENEFYFEAWEDVLNNVQVQDKEGKKYNIFQNEDVWAIPVNMEFPEDF